MTKSKIIFNAPKLQSDKVTFIKNCRVTPVTVPNPEFTRVVKSKFRFDEHGAPIQILETLPQAPSEPLPIPELIIVTEQIKVPSRSHRYIKIAECVVPAGTIKVAKGMVVPQFEPVRHTNKRGQLLFA